ncbi:MAG TPA: carboxymuconolactone decarboxylase family protein [Capillimicrobium sp.]|jgi:4-carboxymuconolactone decarboxylase
MPSPRLPAAGGRLTRVFVALARRQYGDPIVESTEVYAHHRRLAMAFVRFNRAVEKPDAIPKRLKDLASLKAATMVECEFCIDIGSHLARDEGITDAQLLALARPHESGLFSEDELLVLDFARAASLTPIAVTDEQVEALRARFGDKGVVELAHMVAWENARARLNGALGIGAGGFSEGRVCALPEREAVQMV